MNDYVIDEVIIRLASSYDCHSMTLLLRNMFEWVMVINILVKLENWFC